MVSKRLPGVVITSGTGVNTLGIVRCFGRRGIPVTYLDSGQGSIVSCSKYINHKLKISPLSMSESDFIAQLMEYGKDKNPKMMIIPAGDEDLLLLAKYKSELETVFILPIPPSGIVNKLVNKKEFYELLDKMNVPHPRTYFPETIDQLLTTGKEITYPYIIKPLFSSLFLKQFHLKVMVVTSHNELVRAVEKLERVTNDVMLQEIISGNDIYEFYGYFDRNSLPLAICGWKKLRHYPADFGSGSFCTSVWQSSEIERCMELLKAIGYYGFANPELKKDPRDGVYKLLEINARPPLQNRLAAACGTDIEYTAYLDAYQQLPRHHIVPMSDINWIDDFVDLASLMVQFKRKEISLRDFMKSLAARKVHSVIACDDVVPLVARILQLTKSLLRLIGSAILGLLTGNSKRPARI